MLISQAGHILELKAANFNYAAYKVCQKLNFGANDWLDLNLEWQCTFNPLCTLSEANIQAGVKPRVKIGVGILSGDKKEAKEKEIKQKANIEIDEEKTQNWVGQEEMVGRQAETQKCVGQEKRRAIKKKVKWRLGK